MGQKWPVSNEKACLHCGP